MNILFVTFGFLPAEAWGGPVKIVDQNAREMRQRGHEITICTPNLLDKQQRIEDGNFERLMAGLRVVYLQTYWLKRWRGTIGPTWMGPIALWWLWKEVASADVVHINTIRTMIGMATIFFAFLQRTPYTLQPHGELPHIVSSIRLKAIFDKLFMGFIVGSAKSFIAGQPSEVQQIINAGGNEQRIHIVPNGIQDANYQPDVYRGQFREHFNIAPERKIVLFLARINPKKGTDLLVKAFAKLPGREKTQLVIAGPDDGQLQEVQELLHDLNLTLEVLLPGLLTGDCVKAAHVDADIFILPCRRDTFPMALVEACQAGTPIITTDGCEIAHILEDKAAIITPVDVDALTEAMRTLLNNQSLYAQYSHGGRELVNTVFSIGAVGQQLEDIYRACLS